jgi:ubiquinone biosynthesis accessory factor UbiK
VHFFVSPASHPDANTPDPKPSMPFSARTQTLLDDLQTRISAALRASPAADLERNLKALVSQGFQRLDLVTREELDVQIALMERLRARVTELERVVAELQGEKPPAG